MRFRRNRGHAARRPADPAPREPLGSERNTNRAELLLGSPSVPRQQGKWGVGWPVRRTLAFKQARTFAAHAGGSAASSDGTMAPTNQDDCDPALRGIRIRLPDRTGPISSHASPVLADARPREPCKQTFVGAASALSPNLGHGACASGICFTSHAFRQIHIPGMGKCHVGRIRTVPKGTEGA